MDQVLTTLGLTKRYGGLTAVDQLSLEVGKGTIFGLLGPNGSGKTTTLGMLLDIIQPTSGAYQWFGQAGSPGSRKRIGSILETPNFMGYLSGERNLKIAAEIKGVAYDDIERVLKIVELYDRKDDRFKTYSLGMKQRLALASALLGNPEVLLLDEPTNGLDPQGIADVRELIRKVAREYGITVILASHLLDEVEKLCSHVAIIKKGKLLVQGGVDEILGEEHIVEVQATDNEQLLKALNSYSGISDIKKELDKYVVKVADGATNETINKFLFEQGVVLTHLASRKKNLEAEFLELTKEGA